jgi:hypothetical protein
LRDLERFLNLKWAVGNLCECTDYLVSIDLSEVLNLKGLLAPEERGDIVLKEYVTER